MGFFLSLPFHDTAKNLGSRLDRRLPGMEKEHPWGRREE
jgi:hypothetical protein